VSDLKELNKTELVHLGGVMHKNKRQIQWLTHFQAFWSKEYVETVGKTQLIYRMVVKVWDTGMKASGSGRTLLLVNYVLMVII
jgi:hypothetical protein